MRIMIILLLLPLLIAAIPEVNVRQAWNFDNDQPGAKPPGFLCITGLWQVRAAVAPSSPHVLAQSAKSGGDACNLALIAGGSYKDLEVSVRLRAVQGTTEQGGGVALRVKDGGNYYAAVYNPLNSSYRLYRFQNNGRVELARADLGYASGWHHLRVTMAGDHLEGFFDGKKYWDVRDSTFRTGTAGVWTRGDAQTFFDDFAVMSR